MNLNSGLLLLLGLFLGFLSQWGGGGGSGGSGRNLLFGKGGWKGWKSLWKANSHSNDLYIDMGALPNAPSIYDSNCIDWTALVIYWDCINTVYSPLWVNAKKAGASKTYFAFSQVADIIALSQHQQGPAGYDDTIGLFYGSPGLNYPISGASPPVPNNDLLGAFVQMGLNQGLSTVISFGGQNAGASDWLFPQSDTVSLANTLVSWAKSYKITGFDFDIESDYIWQNPQSQIEDFFQTLKASGMDVTGAFLGSFYQETNHVYILQYLTKINLMLYSGYEGAQYLDPSFLQPWLPLPGIDNDPSRLSIGFDTDEEYEDPSQSCAQVEWCPVIPAGTSRGAAAWMTYVQLLQQLSPPLTWSQFGPTFWWADTPGAWVQAQSSQTTTILDFWKQEGSAT